VASPDYDLVKLLIRGGKPVFLAVNKSRRGHGDGAENFASLAFATFIHQCGTCAGHRDLLDAISEAIPEPADVPLTEKQIADEAAATEAGPDAEDAEQLHRTHGEFEQHETR